MKKFKYSLQTVADYKQQVLDRVKGEYADRQKRVRDKKEAIEALKSKRQDLMVQFDEVKLHGAGAQTYLMYSSMIDQFDDQIRTARKELAFLEKKAEEKKKEVIEATIDVNKLEQLKDRRYAEYNKAAAKEQETFIEEFVAHQKQTG